MTRRAWVVPAVLVVALAGLAAWQGPRFLDWDRYRGTVERVAAAGLGRPVRIAGPIRLSLLPQATLRAVDVTVADSGDGAGATVGELRMRVGLGALLTGRVEPQDLVLQGARMHLPWPLAGFAPNASPLGALHARVEGGTLLIGDLAITGISGELSMGENGLSASGLATVLGHPWRMTGRLGRPGTDGAATVAISLDGMEAVGTGGALAGQMAADGSVSGRITGRGPDLSVLLPAPPQPWTADGRLVAGSGLIVADDLELVIGGAPARGAVALRLLPELRLDAALATNRLDLDAWLPPLLRGGPVTLPTGVDLSAEAAPFAGGTLRRLRAGFEFGGGSVTLRPSDVVLPGDAPLHLAGVLTNGRFDGTARLSAPNVPQTATWLQASAPALLGAVPLAALHTATLDATVHADGTTLAFDGLAGEVDGVKLAGTLALGGGRHPAAAADLRLAAPVLDRILPQIWPTPTDAAAGLAAVSRWAAGFDADVTVTAERPVWHGTAYDRLVLDGAVRGGTVELRQAALSGAGLSLAASGTLDAASRITDGRLAVTLAEVAGLAGQLPPAWQAARPLVRGAAALDATVSGPPGAWAMVARLDGADARLQVNGRADLPGRHWAGSVSFHHPGAPRFLASLGLTGLAGWLGDGSLSLEGTADAAPGRVALRGDLSAGGLRGTGALTVTRPGMGPPSVTGSLDMDTLPVPLPDAGSTDPLSFGVLRLADAAVSVRAAHLLWGASPEGGAASARVTLSGGVLHLDEGSAHLAGGVLTGALVVDTTGPPLVQAKAAVTGAVVDGGLFGTPVDVIAGIADGSFDLTATGYSPAALLATLAGPASGRVRNGALSGLDAGQVLSVLRRGPGDGTVQAGVADALQGGGTPFTTLDTAGTAANGLLTLGTGRMEAPAGTTDVSGSIDLPGGTLDLTLGLHPALEAAPTIGLRLIGPAAAPTRTPGLADVTRWVGGR